jgi:hypothetical protein
MHACGGIVFFFFLLGAIPLAFFHGRDVVLIPAITDGGIDIDVCGPVWTTRTTDLT